MWPYYLETINELLQLYWLELAVSSSPLVMMACINFFVVVIKYHDKSDIFEKVSFCSHLKGLVYSALKSWWQECKVMVTLWLNN